MLMLLAIPLVALADTWDYYVEFTVSDNSSTDRLALPILTGIPAQSLINADFLDPSGNITRMNEGSISRDYGVATGNITLFIPSLLANQSRTFKFYMDYIPSVVHKIIVGVGGYFTVADNTTLEPGDNFTIGLSGYIDTTANGDNQTIFDHFNDVQGGLELYVSDTVSGNITARTKELTYDNYTEDMGGANDNLNKTDVVYATAHDAAVGNFGGATLVCGQALGFTIWRSFLVFDTTAATPNPSAARIYLKLTSDVSVVDFDVVVQDGQPAFPNDPLQVGDYLYTQYTGDGGSLNTAGLVVGNIYSIDLNADGLSWINTGGHTKLALISSNDIADTPPAGNEYVIFEVASYYLELGYGNDVEIFATGVSSGEHDIEVTGNTTDLAIWVDGIEKDNIAIGAGIQDVADNWTFMSDATPYASSVNIIVDGVLQAWYEPNTMIIGTTLPDRQGGDHNGTITWGANPAGILVSVGGITSYESAVSTSEADSEVSYELPSGSGEEPAGWFVSGVFGGTLTPELKETISDAASDMGMPEQTLWVLLWFGIAIAIGLSIVIFTGSILISLIVVIAILWGGVTASVIDFGLVMLLTVLGFGGLYLAKQH